MSRRGVAILQAETRRMTVAAARGRDREGRAHRRRVTPARQPTGTGRHIGGAGTVRKAQRPARKATRRSPPGTGRRVRHQGLEP